MKYSDFSREVTAEKVTLEKIQFQISQAVSKSFLRDIDIYSYDDMVADGIIKQLRFYLVGNKVNEEEYDDIIREYPATIWEELKRDFWPKWLKRRFPVRYSRDIVHKNVKHYHVCPHLETPSNQPDHINFMLLNDVEAIPFQADNSSIVSGGVRLLIYVVPNKGELIMRSDKWDTPCGAYPSRKACSICMMKDTCKSSMAIKTSK
uniref:Uncharacterized protein n=1 Tax=viral metagenome TaxID=1070528 RepID=A0A6M3JLQ6_9ZZZZ